MPQKKTIQEIRQEFERLSYTLLTEEYINSTQKLKFVCDKGHEGSMRYAAIQQGKRCYQCSIAESGRKRRKNLEDINRKFVERGFELLSTKYEGKKSKLTCKCPKGHLCHISWDNFNSGHGCKQCGIESSATKQKLTYEQVKAIFDGAGYLLLTKTYINAKQKLEYLCPNNHRNSITINDFKHNRRCPDCSKTKITYENISHHFEAEGYKLLTKGCRKSNEKLEFECPNGHLHSMTWNAFQSGTRCGKCYGRNKNEDERRRTLFNRKIRNKISSRMGRVQKGLKIKTSKTKIANQITDAILKGIGYPEEGMSLDHIVPVSFFDLSNEKELKLCWHPQNLRYIPLSENMRRGNRITKKEIDNMNLEQLRILEAASKKPKWIVKYTVNAIINFASKSAMQAIKSAK